MNASDPRHGTANGYQNLKCRCDACRRANTDYMRATGNGGYKADLCVCGKSKRVVSQLCAACWKEKNAPDCGTESGYSAGCRCDRCRETANAARRARRLRPNVAKHGTYAGYSNGCRCDACREGRNAYSRERRAVKAAA